MAEKLKISKLLILILIFSCSHQNKVTNRDVINFCQDLSVLYQKVGAIASNMANEKTTRTMGGGYYKRMIVQNCKDGFCEIKRDEAPPVMKYEPEHPDADKKGYVSYPNINLKQEEANMLTWKKVYETVIRNSPVDQSFFFKDPRARECFTRYPALKEAQDFSSYLGRDLFKN